MKTSHRLTQLFFALIVLLGTIVSASAQAGFPAPAFSDQQAGYMLVYPYYTSNTASAGQDTFITISNVSATNTVGVHLYFMDGQSCAESDMIICLSPNASESFKASDIDPDNTGYIIGYAIQPTGASAGCPDIAANSLIGNAFVNIPTSNIQGAYGAEAINSNARGTFASSCTLAPDGASATLTFPAPNSFAVEIQSPLDIPNQKIVLAGLSGDMNTTLTGAGQVGAGQVINGYETPAVSFSRWIPDGCQTSATLTSNSPRVPSGINSIIPSGQVGTIRFRVTAAVGLLMVPRNAKGRSGIRSLHKVGVTASTLIVPVFMPGC